jgi:cytochrome c-type biogenesis protein CcmF
VEWAERVRLFRAPAMDSWRRAVGLPRAAYGMTLAHAGFAIVVAGITASSAWKMEAVESMRPGDTVELAGYLYRFDGVDQDRGPNYALTRGRFTVTRDGAPVATLVPERRLYDVQQRQTTEAAILTTGFADLYAVIGDADGRGGHTVRIYHEPLVPWMWAGALVMMLGGLVSLSDRRLSGGAPARAARRPALGAVGA